MTAPEPTPRDVENACCRWEIADRQRREYEEAEALAAEALGPGWKPWMKLALIDSDYYLRQAPCEPVATAYKVFRGGKTTENSVFVRRMPDGTVQHAESYEPLFGDLLDEKHPTRTMEIRGEQVHPLRYSLCWSALELYEPKSASDLARLRQEREQRAVEAEAEGNLFAEQVRAEGYVRPGRTGPGR